MARFRPIGVGALLLVVVLSLGCGGPTGAGGRGALASSDAGTPPELQRINTLLADLAARLEPGLEPRGQVREQRVDALELRRRAGIRARERTPTPGAGRAAAAEREHDDEQQGAHTDRSEPRHLDPPLHGAPPSIRR